MRKVYRARLSMPSSDASLVNEYLERKERKKEGTHEEKDEGGKEADGEEEETETKVGLGGGVPE